MQAVLEPSDWSRNIDHGEQCDCRVLASAVGAESSAVDFWYCQTVLQKRWKIKCNHGCRDPGVRVTPELPPRDPDDAIQAILIVNAGPLPG